MPTISIFKKDFESLLGSAPQIKRPVSIERLEDWLMLVKGELKEHVAVDVRAQAPTPNRRGERMRKSHRGDGDAGVEASRE